MIVIAVGRAVALSAVCHDNKVVLGQVDNMLNTALSVNYLLCDLLFGSAIALNVGDGGVKQYLAAVIGDVLAHRQDHGLILIVAGEAERGQIGQTVDVMDVALEIKLHLKGAVPFLKGKHGLPVCPEVGVVEVVIENIVDGFVFKGLVGAHKELEKLRCRRGIKAVLSVGMRVLALLFGDAAEGEVGVFLVQVIVLGEHGLARVDDRGDGLEQIPHTLEVVIHFTSAAHYEALCGVIYAVTRAACKGKMLVQGDVIAGHLCVTDEEAGRRKPRKAGADYVGILVFNAFWLFGGCKGLVVTAAVIHFCTS